MHNGVGLPCFWHTCVLWLRLGYLPSGCDFSKARCDVTVALKIVSLKNIALRFRCRSEDGSMSDAPAGEREDVVQGFEFAGTLRRNVPSTGV